MFYVIEIISAKVFFKNLPAILTFAVFGTLGYLAHRTHWSAVHAGQRCSRQAQAAAGSTDTPRAAAAAAKCVLLTSKLIARQATNF